jgi:8-oxo-dGTP pyrophosphatase MutT (NUDIX family)
MPIRGAGLPSRGPTRSLLAPSFVVSAGCVVFRHVRSADPSKPLQVCLLHHVNRDQWLLPKGRLERGESPQQGALRETAEETGYTCRALPVRMRTRAPAAGSDLVDRADGELVEGCATEPFTITIREFRKKGTKFIWWYVAEVVDEDAPPAVERREEDEVYRGVFVDVDKAWLTFKDDWEILDGAMALVKDTYQRGYSGSDTLPGYEEAICVD